MSTMDLNEASAFLSQKTECGDGVISAFYKNTQNWTEATTTGGGLDPPHSELGGSRQTQGTEGAEAGGGVTCVSSGPRPHKCLRDTSASRREQTSL